MGAEIMSPTNCRSWKSLEVLIYPEVCNKTPTAVNYIAQKIFQPMKSLVSEFSPL